MRFNIPVKDIYRASSRMIVKYTPEILTGIGISGMITAIVLAVKATPKAMEHIKEEEAESAKEVVKAVWKDYIPTIAVTGLSVACLLGSNSVSFKRNTALAAAYKLSENAFTEYQDKVKSTVGERKEKQIQEEVAADKAKNIEFKESDIHNSTHGESIFIDGPTGQVFKSNKDYVEKVIAKINEQVSVYDFIPQNEFLSSLDCGLNEVSKGDDIGWFNSKDKKLIVHFGSTIKYNQPCFVMNYKVFADIHDTGE